MEKPTKPEWYWYRRDVNQEPDVVIEDRRGSGFTGSTDLVVIAHGSSIEFSAWEAQHAPGHWIGPMEMSQ